MHRFIKLSVSAFTLAALMPTVSFAQDTGKLYRELNGWKINSYKSSETSTEPSCSAVFIQNRYDGLRVERFNEGYLFGINGLSRKQQGERYGLKFWFNGDKAGAANGEAKFVKDAGYELDDWLSYFHAADAKPSPIAAISGKNSISFSFQMPGNRTGNDEVTTTFSLKGSAAAMGALQECYKVAVSGTAMGSSQPAGASDCPDDGIRLPGSGVCQGRGVNHLEIAGGNQPILPENCEWRLNEAAMPGGEHLLYLASSCGNYLTKIDFSAGAKTAKLSLATSAMSGGQGWEFGTVIAVDDNNPQASLLQFIQNSTDDKAEAAKCHAVKGDTEGGWPADAIVFDSMSEAEATADMQTSQEPRFACGPYGLTQESTAYWRIFGGFAWYFDLGQDAYFDVDMRSLTVYSK